MDQFLFIGFTGSLYSSEELFPSLFFSGSITHIDDDSIPLLLISFTFSFQTFFSPSIPIQQGNSIGNVEGFVVLNRAREASLKRKL